MHLIVVVPRLFAAPSGLGAAPSRSRALARLMGIAARRRAEGGLEQAMLEACGIGGLSCASLVARARDTGDEAAAWLVADPVVLVAGIDDVRIAARVDDLAEGEAAGLQRTLNAHFAQDGLRFLGPPWRWLAAIDAAPDARTTPTASALGASLWAHRPQGPDARRLERIGNEAQMLLHEHPVNLARIARGLAPVGGLWLWGTASLQGDPAQASDAGPVELRTAEVDPGGAASGELRDLVELARGVALHARAKGDRDAAVAAAARTASGSSGTVPTPAAHPVRTLLIAGAEPPDAFEREVLGPAVDALWHARALAGASEAVSRLTLVGSDGEGAAQRLDAQRPTLMQRVAGRWRSRAFEPGGTA